MKNSELKYILLAQDLQQELNALKKENERLRFMESEHRKTIDTLSEMYANMKAERNELKAERK